MFSRYRWGYKIYFISQVYYDLTNILLLLIYNSQIFHLQLAMLSKIKCFELKQTYFHANLLPNTWFANICPPKVAFSFCWLFTFLWRSFLVWYSFTSPFCFYWLLCVSYQKKIISNTNVEKAFPYLFFISFIVSGHTLKHLIGFELIFVYSVR